MAAKQQSSSQTFFKNLQVMLTPKAPSGPPLPKKEILALLRKLRAQLDRLIAAVEKYGGKPAPRAPRRKPRKKA